MSIARGAFGLGRRRLALTVAALLVPDSLSLTAPKVTSSKRLELYVGLCDISVDLAQTYIVTPADDALEFLHSSIALSVSASR